MHADTVGQVTEVDREHGRATVRLAAPLHDGEKVRVQRGAGAEGSFAFRATRMRRGGERVQEARPGEEVSVAAPDIVEELDELRRAGPGRMRVLLGRLLGRREPG